MARRRTPRVTFAAAALAVAGCCPPPEPIEPTSLQGPPQVIPAQMIPPAIVSRYEQPRLTTSLEPINRDPLKEPGLGPPVVPPPLAPAAPPLPPPAVPPAAPKTETSPPREALEPAVPPGTVDTLPDEVVLRLIESGRAAFVRCFKKAVAADPLVVSFKVRVHVELDVDGAISRATADTSDTALATCLTRAVRYLRFPASGRPVAADLPLFYRAE